MQIGMASIKSHSGVRAILLREGEVLGDRRFNLHLHLVVHVPLGLTPAAVDNNDVDKDECNNDANDRSNTDAVTVDDGRLLNFLLLVQRLEALIGWMGESRTDCIKDTQWLDLSAVGLLVDHD